MNTKPYGSFHQSIDDKLIAEILSLESNSAINSYLQFLLLTGCRPSEGLGICWSDIDLIRMIIIIRRQQYYDIERKSYILKDVIKNYKKRNIVIGSMAASILRQRKEQQDKDRLLASDKWVQDTDLVFTDEYGNPIRLKMARDKFARIAAMAGCDKARLYDLRHTAATVSYKSCGELQLVKEMLGHNSADTTARYYIDRDDCNKIKLATAIDSYYKNVIGTGV